MPMRATIEKFLPAQGEYWTNVYWLDYLTPAAALEAVRDIVTAERTVHLPAVQFTKFRVDDGVEDTEIWETETLNVAGLSTTTGEMMPLFVVARVDFSVAGGGRPSRKYLRGVLTEETVNAFMLNTGIRGVLQNYADGVIAAGGVCDVDGQGFSNGSPFAQPGMRQLRRGSKRKPVPSSGGTPV